MFYLKMFILFVSNENEQQTKLQNLSALHKSSNSLITLEVPSMKNKLYPTMIKEEVELAKKYIGNLPEDVMSVGRMGTYRYVDIDDIIMQGLQFSKSLYHNSC